MDMNTAQLCVILDMKVDPPVVSDVEIMHLNNSPAYNATSQGPSPVLTQVTCGSIPEALHALKGIIESDPALAWTHQYPGMQRFLNPWGGNMGPPEETVRWDTEETKAARVTCQHCNASKGDKPHKHFSHCIRRKDYELGLAHKRTYVSCTCGDNGPIGFKHAADCPRNPRDSPTFEL